MYGWRGRLGLIVPSSNTTNEPEFERHLPEGVSLHTARMFLEDTNAEHLEEMAAEAERSAELLATADVDVVAYGCTTGSLVKGPGYDEEIESRLSEVAGVPAVATAAAIKRAFNTLDIERLAITTPYIQDLNEREEDFLTSAGYEVTDMTGLGIEPNTGIGEQRQETAYREAHGLDASSADGIFISCTNYRTFEIIESLEADLGTPVVTSNQATLWNALREIGVDYSDIDLGQLFQH
jgi:maleate isomerase